MAFSIKQILKGLSIFQAGTLTPASVDILPGGAASTKTTIQAAQSANQTLTLPDNTGTILSDASTIDFDQMETLSANQVLITDNSGVVTTSTVTSTELSYIDNVTSDVQAQLNTHTANIATNATAISTETSNRIAADALKADLTLGNILPTATININGQKITNSAAPTVGSDLTNKTYVDAAVTGGGANLTLSNLTNPTAINQNLLPSGTRTLGTSSALWDFLFVSNIAGTFGDNFDVNARTFKDSGNNLSIDYQNRLLKSGATTKLNWSGTDLDINTRKIINAVDPTSAQDVSTKAYTDTYRNSSVSVSRSSGGSSFTSRTIQVFNNVLWDDFGSSYNTTTGIFTAPKAGKYKITTNVVSSSITLSGAQSIATYVVDNSNNSITGNGNVSNFNFGNATAHSQYVNHTYIVNLTASQQIALAMSSDVSTNLLTTSSMAIAYLGA